MRKKQFLSLFLIIALLLPCSFLVSCEQSPEKYSAYSLDYFDTATSITGYAKSKQEFDEISGEILKELEEYHKLFTIYHRYEGLENMCTVNELKDGAHRVVKVDTRIIDMLLYAKDIYTKSQGKVNIAMGSVLSIWHNYRTQGSNDPANAELPPSETLKEAAKHTNIEDLIIDQNNSTVFLKDPKMTLDVGAIAKGYAVEAVAKSLEEKGISGYVINVGGNVRTVGIKGDGEKWLVGVENPIDNENEQYIAYLNFSGESVVTSGSYQRFYFVNGRKYHHIIDTETLMPAENYLSVSVIAKSSADGDALSTALFCLPYEDGLALLNTFEDAEAMWVYPDGSKKYSEGFRNYTTEI